MANYDANTIMGCHFNSAQWSGSFFSDGANFKYWYMNDAAGNSTTYQSSTVQKKFGDRSMGLGGYSGTRAANCLFSDSQLTTASSFSVDFWIYLDRYSGFNLRFASTSYTYRLSFLINGWSSPNLTGQLVIKNTLEDNVVIYNGVTIPENTWTHIYIGRNTVGGASGTHTYYYGKNGVVTNLGTFSGTNGTFEVDRYYGCELKGTSNPNYTTTNTYVDEIRISNKARWTANFDVPTQEYSDTYTGEGGGVVTPTVTPYGFIIGGML